MPDANQFRQAPRQRNSSSLITSHKTNSQAKSESPVGNRYGNHRAGHPIGRYQSIEEMTSTMHTYKARPPPTFTLTLAATHGDDRLAVRQLRAVLKVLKRRFRFECVSIVQIKRNVEMKATIKNSGIPVGSYIAEFTRIEKVDHDDFGAGWKWVFTVAEGKHTGEEAYRTTKPLPTPKNSCGKFLGLLSGQAPADGMQVDTDDYKGNRYNVIVEDAPNGNSTRISTFVTASE